MQLVLGKRGDYAIRAVLDIATHFGSRRKAREISSHMSIPQKYLSRILADLVRAGVLRAAAGQEGGYELVATPESATVLEVIDAVEGPTGLRECLLRGTPCDSGRTCSLHEPWIEAEEAMLAKLRTTTFADLSSQARRRKRASTRPRPGGAPPVGPGTRSARRQTPHAEGLPIRVSEAKREC